MSTAFQASEDVLVQVRSAYSFDDLTQLMTEGAIVGKDVEFEPRHFLSGPEDGLREVWCRALHHLDAGALGAVEGGFSHATLSELLSLLVCHGRIPGLKRLVAAARTWRHPATLTTMLYVPALYFFPDDKNYLGLHRLDEPWLPEYGLLVARTDP